MAKRSPRTHADDTATAPTEAQAAVAARPRARRETGTATANARAPKDLGAPGSPNEDEIRLRAYHRYLERGGRDGMDFEDWLEAERELKSRK